MSRTCGGDLADCAVEDLYKRIHQAFLGPGHAIPDHESAATQLDSEWGALSAPRRDEPLIEILAGGAPFVRLNLRPYRSRGGRQELLLAGLLDSARAPQDESGFLAAWRGAGEEIGRGCLPFGIEAYDRLDAALRARDYPPIHHSDAYRLAREPAYRVLGAEIARRLVTLIEKSRKGD